MPGSKKGLELYTGLRAGTLSGAQLETKLADPAYLGAWNLAIRRRGAMRSMKASVPAMAAINASPTALAAYNASALAQGA